MNLKIQILAWIFLIFGLAEVAANLWALGKILQKNDFKTAKTFHGDFPPAASKRAWIVKVLAMFMIGIFAVIASVLILTANPLQTLFILIVSGSMLAVGLIQSLSYGSKHLPALGSLLIGLLFTALTYFLGLNQFFR